MGPKIVFFELKKLDKNIDPYRGLEKIYEGLGTGSGGLKLAFAELETGFE